MNNRMMIAGLALLGGAALASVSPARAADTSEYDQTQTVARCVVQAAPEQSKELLATTPYSDQSRDAMKALDGAWDSCVKASGDGKLKMKELQARGALAQQLYLAAFPTPPAPLPEGTEPAPFMGSGDSRLSGYDVTRCAAMRDPVAADALVRSGLKSDAEGAALKQLLPVIGGCTPKGAKIGFDRDGLHAMVAEAMWTQRNMPAE